MTQTVDKFLDLKESMKGIAYHSNPNLLCLLTSTVVDREMERRGGGGNAGEGIRRKGTSDIPWDREENYSHDIRPTTLFLPSSNKGLSTGPRHLSPFVPCWAWAEKSIPDWSCVLVVCIEIDDFCCCLGLRELNLHPGNRFPLHIPFRWSSVREITRSYLWRPIVRIQWGFGFPLTFHTITKLH